MSQIRPAAVAGSFYPASASALGAIVDDYLQQSTSESARPPRAIISPHAGYIYSGAAAGAAFASLRGLADPPTRVLLIGPAHRVGFVGMALSSATAFDTPLGSVPIDQELAQQAAQLDGVITLDQAHEAEHCLEVQLPFLQRSLASFTLLPVLVGNARPEQVTRLIEQFAELDHLLIVISSDLSHYHDYATARQMDLSTAVAIESLQPEQIGHDQACGRLPIQGLLLHARKRGLSVTRMELCNSGDTAGPRDRVVGYGAWQIA